MGGQLCWEGGRRPHWGRAGRWLYWGRAGGQTWPCHRTGSACCSTEAAWPALCAALESSLMETGGLAPSLPAGTESLLSYQLCPSGGVLTRFAVFHYLPVAGSSRFELPKLAKAGPGSRVRLGSCWVREESSGEVELSLYCVSASLPPVGPVVGEPGAAGLVDMVVPVYCHYCLCCH